MSNFIEKDDILGISKKIIRRDTPIPSDPVKTNVISEEQSDEGNSGQTIKNISEAIIRLKEKSSELSEKNIDMDIEHKDDIEHLDDVDSKELNSAEIPIDGDITEKVAVLEDVSVPDESKLPDEAKLADESKLSDEAKLSEASVHETEQKNSVDLQYELVEQLKNEIEFLKAQIDVKDGQLNTKDKQLSTKDELILNFQVLLKSEQDKVLRLESESVSDEQVDTTSSNKTWIEKIFGKRTR